MKLLGWISEGSDLLNRHFLYGIRFAYALTALGEFGYATSLGKIYDEFRVLEGDKPIPKRAFMYFSISESFIRAFRGEKPLLMHLAGHNNDEKAAEFFSNIRNFE